MSDAIFPLEILEKIAEAADDDYSTQAQMCLVSRALFTFTQPRLYHSFNSVLVYSPSGFESYLNRICQSTHLAKLVNSFCVVSMNKDLPRAVSTALLSMPNLKDLTLIVQQTATPNNPYHDIWRDLFQATDIPFQLEALRLHMRVDRFPSDRFQGFESMSLAIFLRTQKALHTLHCFHQTALIGRRDLPNLRRVVIDPSNWEYILTGRSIELLSLDANLREAEPVVKKRITPGSPIATSLGSVKRLRIDAEVMEKCNLSFYLRSLEFLISTNFNDTKHRSLISLLPKIKVVVIRNPKGSAQKRKATADWLLANVNSLTDVVYSAPLNAANKREYICERYRRGVKTPETMGDFLDYQELVGYE
ncbi:hypothetical protein D9756_009287 [Leucocoprinus leucothites]|uniref:Uncharacterized protein n=1 Tax=Leucocoprinus leucothites TaxID=201217 RepID=A0A8H5CXP4_9AGAR|nr:hypothetical protein D9756_009287 [Leucoagaricus leucothites]